MAYEPNSLLGRLVGFRLYSVQFVMDYVQLHFDGPTDDTPALTCDVLPTITLPGQRFSASEVGWTEALRGFITQNVTATHERTGIGVKLDFATGSIQWHPTGSELVGPEIATLSGFADRSWMTWRPGEDAFEDL